MWRPAVFTGCWTTSVHKGRWRSCFKLMNHQHALFSFFSLLMNTGTLWNLHRKPAVTCCLQRETWEGEKVLNVETMKCETLCSTLNQQNESNQWRGLYLNHVYWLWSERSSCVASHCTACSCIDMRTGAWWGVSSKPMC